MASETDQSRDGTSTRIVALSASATNTRSLEMLLSRLAPQPDTTLIVVLERREALVEERFWQAVAQGAHRPADLSDGAPVEPGRLYLSAADLIVTLEDGRFRTLRLSRTPAREGSSTASLSRSRRTGATSPSWSCWPARTGTARWACAR